VFNYLQTASLECEPTEKFDHRVSRRVNVDIQQSGWSYWSPAILAGIASAFIFFAFIGILYTERQETGESITSGKAAQVRRMERPRLLLENNTESR
jgi:hypothetical protein